MPTAFYLYVETYLKGKAMLLNPSN